MSNSPTSEGAITPSAFTPLEAGAKPRKPGLNPLKWLVAAAVVATLLALWFLFTARSVQFLVNGKPGAQIDIDGGLVISMGQRKLMRQGPYTVAMRAEGYHPRTSDIEVTGEDTQQFQFSLQPLPGIVQISSQPEGAEITLDGETLGLTPLEKNDIEAGEYQLRLQRERYLPLEQTLTVTGRRQRQTLDLALEPAWAEVSVTSTPEGAAVLVDGEWMGETPAALPILQGKREVTLQLAGFADVTQTLELVAGDTIDLPAVQLIPAAGVLQLSSNPSGANVTLNGEFAGQTPLELELTPATNHRISLSRAGYRRASRSIEMRAGEQQALKVKLKAQLGEVSIAISPPQARVLIDNSLIGTGDQTLSLPSREQTLVVELEGYASFRQRFTPRPGLRQQISAELITVEADQLVRIPPETATSLGHAMKLFRGGEFTLGSTRREPGRSANEILRPVSLTRPFYLATTEVTNAQYRLFAANHNSGQVKGNTLNRDKQPVVKVSWQQAAQFCNWLSREEGLPPFYREAGGVIAGFDPKSTGYRLPTEAEWAFAARYTEEGLLRYPWGDSFPPPAVVENYADTSAAYITGRHINNYMDNAVVSANVGTYQANHNGLYDMGGNVAEWMHDIYTIDAAGGKTEMDPLGAQEGANYTIRGGSWALGRLTQVRLAYRDYGERGRDDVGFRVARYAE